MDKKLQQVPGPVSECTEEKPGSLNGHRIHLTHPNTGAKPGTHMTPFSMTPPHTPALRTEVNPGSLPPTG